MRGDTKIFGASGENFRGANASISYASKNVSSRGLMCDDVMDRSLYHNQQRLRVRI